VSGLLQGKYVLVTGVITTASIAFSVARLAQQAGAHVVLTGHGRLRLIEQVASKLEPVPAVIELDVTRQEHLDTLASRVGSHIPHLDGVLHAVAFAPPAALGGDFITTGWNDVATTLRVSAFSLQALAASLQPLLRRGSAIVGLDFDATRSWPDYNWMGVAKAALESTARYLARDLGRQGVRVNLVAAGPLRTIAAHGEPSFERIASSWRERAPLGWDSGDPEGVARTCVALLSDWLPATTGDIVHADGGFHSVAL
jgi:enoyl-[acyl-carrier-protein] reductase (NADH)